MPEVKRNLVQVRLTDNQLKQFDAIKKSLHAANNADTVRKLIIDKKLTNGTTQETLHKLVARYNDLSAQLDSLLWNSSNVTNNVNQVSHVLNIAAQEDPGDAETWNWVIQQLQLITSSINNLNKLANEAKRWLHESRVVHGNLNV